MLLDEIERLIRRDPARRGLISAEDTLPPLCPGHLTAAATDLARHGGHIVIVTGFYIPAATPPAAETDGPPGAAILAAALTHAGMSIRIVTDQACHHATAVAAEEMNLPNSCVTAIPNDPQQIHNWFHQELADNSHPPWTHLIAIERVGPSHTANSIRAQLAATSHPHLPDLQEFEQLVPIADRDHCYNMRGQPLDDYTAPLHLLFELAQTNGPVRTIGIGDGGNEIGMGTIPWSDLRRRLNGTHAARIPCRVRTDWTIVTGVSNWGGMALAAATLALSDRTEILAQWNSPQQQRLLTRLIEDGPAVDGVTRMQEPTVDGLPFLTYIQPWEGILRLIRTWPQT
jgi:D-glutamate cyclase